MKFFSEIKTALTLAAKLHSVPVMVCAATFKLCPRYLCSYDQVPSGLLMPPSGHGRVRRTYVFHPLYDYVPPELVGLFIFNM